MIRSGRPLTPNVGDFARLVIVCAIYRHILSSHESIRGVFFPRPDHRDIAIRNLNSGAAEAMEILLLGMTGSSNVGDGILNSRVESYALLGLMLLHAPRKNILKYALSFADRNLSKPEEDKVTAWIESDSGREARKGANYAACLLATLRRSSSHGFHQPIATLWAALVLWTFSRFATKVDNNGDGFDDGIIGFGDDGTRPSGRRRQQQGATIRLDNAWASREVKAWHDGAVGIRPYVKDIGNICRPRAGSQIIDVAISMLSDMRAWTFSNDLAGWLQDLKVCAEAPRQAPSHTDT